MNKFEDHFYNQPKTYQSHKWTNYFEIYDKHFSRFQGKNPTVLEVGVKRGGSLEMWNYYFDGQCKIYGIDVNMHCLQIRIPNVEVIMGDQGSVDFWDRMKSYLPKIDIFIDDGSHHSSHQITTFDCMYDHISDDGIYLCEDVHCSYRGRYGGGLRDPRSFIEYTKLLIDKLNARHHRPIKESFDFVEKTYSMTFYDNVVVIEKRKNEKETTTVKSR